MRVGPAGGPVELGPGDYATFPGDAPHDYEALEPGSWAVLVMEHH
jgi:quercetin dioxygenase-like cupin family protein